MNPEIILKEHRNTLTASKHRTVNPSKKARRHAALQSHAVIRPHSVTAHYLSGKQFEKQARIQVSTPIKSTHSTFAVARVGAISGMPPKIAQMLTLLGVKDNNCAFLKNTPEAAKLLAAVSGFVCYGEPTRETVEKVIFQRGKIIIEGGQTVAVDNQLIEEMLGGQGFFCVQDCANEIFEGGVKFDVVNGIFRKFELNQQKYDEGGKGRTGYVGAKINKFILGLI